MELLKCKNCGGPVMRIDALNCECQVCKQRYDIGYMSSYEDKSDFFEQNAVQVKQLLNGMKIHELANLINLNYSSNTLMADDETKFSEQYEIEYSLICAALDAINEFIEDFGSYPYDTNTVNMAINVVANVRDVIYGVCEKTDNKINYEFIMSYVSNKLNRAVLKGYNFGRDRWDRYSHEEDDDGWKEYITILSNCIILLDTLDKYGPVHLEYVYDNLIDYEETAIDLTYVHYYWIGDYRATQNVGLTEEAKARRRKDLENFKARRTKIQNKTKKIEEARRKAEEERLEAEKQERIKKFWSENAELKDALLKEQAQLEVEIKQLESKRDSINADKEISDLKEEIQLANSTLAVLGFFAIKEKKVKKLQIEQLNRDIYKAKEKVKKDKEEVQKVIDSKKHRIVEIENEFIKDR